MLDEQLCGIYTNDIAKDLLAVGLRDVGGRPLGHFLARPQPSASAVLVFLFRARAPLPVRSFLSGVLRHSSCHTT